MVQKSETFRSGTDSLEISSYTQCIAAFILFELEGFNLLNCLHVCTLCRFLKVTTPFGNTFCTSIPHHSN